MDKVRIETTYGKSMREISLPLKSLVSFYVHRWTKEQYVETDYTDMG